MRYDKTMWMRAEAMKNNAETHHTPSLYRTACRRMSNDCMHNVYALSLIWRKTNATVKGYASTGCTYINFIAQTRVNKGVSKQRIVFRLIKLSTV